MDMQHLEATARHALQAMQAAGFEHVQASASHTLQTELNVNHNEPSLMRSTDGCRLSLLGIVQGRKASTDLTNFDADAVAARARALFADAQAAPPDEANAVSSGQAVHTVKGPQEADLALMTRRVAELLAFRAAETPQMILDEGFVKHALHRWHTCTSGGSELSGSVGSYEASVFGTGTDGERTSSFNYTGGSADDLDAPIAERFGVGAMMRDTVQQIDTAPLGDKFVGEVVLTPNAVEDLLGWLVSQLGDLALISGTSLYKDRVGESIASGLLSVRSRFSAPGVAPQTGDGFAASELTLLDRGTLKALIPSLYGSRKTGRTHVPTVDGAWEIDAGTTPLERLTDGIERGAVVGRFSMGQPASNGDFAGVIKNSFVVRDGRRGTALAETMVSGNMAQMLQDIVAVSAERIDSGASSLPWIRIRGLHFS